MNTSNTVRLSELQNNNTEYSKVASEDQESSLIGEPRTSNPKRRLRGNAEAKSYQI